MTIAITGVFLAASIWWILYDKRIPGGGDPGRHLLEAIGLADRVRAGDLLAPLTFDPPGGYFYPPLVRTIGAVPDLLGLPVVDWGPIAINLVFLPVLAAGCYLTGRLVFGAFAGLLAAIFALGAPMIMALFHVYLLDAPLAALVALALWAVLASDGFTRRRQSILAGALVGLAMLVKTTAPLFVAGAVLVILVRGGWRQWRNLGLALLALLVVAGPFYAVHLDELINLSREASLASSDPWTVRHGAVFDGIDRIGPQSMAWYGWAALNAQLALPLFALFAVGLGWCLIKSRGRRHVPELVAGALVGYLAMTWLAVHDPRYTLPLVVYFAVIGTGWIAASSRRRVANAGLAVLGIAVALNFASNGLGLFSSVRVELWQGYDPQSRDIVTPLVDPGTATLIDGDGFGAGDPRPNPLWIELLEASERNGVETIGLGVLQGAPYFRMDHVGLDALADGYGISADATTLEPVDGRRFDLLVYAWWWIADPYWRDQGLATPCAQVEDGTNNGDPDRGGTDLVGPDDGIPTSVLVLRRERGEYERWCGWRR